MIWIQITAGKGPVECAWAVVQVMAKLIEEAEGAGFAVKTLEIELGPQAGTAQSVVISISGGSGDLSSFVDAWRGTVQWIARSPFRPEHKRKNWFVGVDVLTPVDETHFDPRDVRWETMRASGPGGQHVNRTESAVRATHVPSGLQATAMEERSQHRNRKLALARLARKLAEAGEKKHAESLGKRWKAHQDLERGNPVRTFRMDV